MAVRREATELQPVEALVMEQAGIQIFDQVDMVVKTVFADREVIRSGSTCQQAALYWDLLLAGSCLLYTSDAADDN